MTAQTRAVNKAVFEQGDRPQGSNYVDLIDSFLSLQDTTAQTMNSDLTAQVITATEVSAGTVNAATVSVSALTVTVTTTVAASGGVGGAVPTSADGFFPITVGGNIRYVPFFKVK
ncbi:MAG: hypothetical protein C4523_02525 [Myxococcales bacterium]|jgi:autotransporter adhesin|nr:MAG: hypothetical protein C4523_02525 [Myxococcales bacterium]